MDASPRYLWRGALKPWTTVSFGLLASDAIERNSALERFELDSWRQAPDTFTAYYKFPNQRPTRGVVEFTPSLDGAVITTWPGTVLGSIIDARVYRHNFGGRMIALTVKGTNGAIYSGRASYDNGDIVNLRRATRGGKRVARR